MGLLRPFCSKLLGLSSKSNPIPTMSIVTVVRRMERIGIGSNLLNFGYINAIWSHERLGAVMNTGVDAGWRCGLRSCLKRKGGDVRMRWEIRAQSTLQSRTDSRPISMTDYPRIQSQHYLPACRNRPPWVCRKEELKRRSIQRCAHDTLVCPLLHKQASTLSDFAAFPLLSSIIYRYDTLLKSSS